LSFLLISAHKLEIFVILVLYSLDNTKLSVIFKTFIDSSHQFIILIDRNMHLIHLLFYSIHLRNSIFFFQIQLLLLYLIRNWFC
jgi:hypothetical protein